jgi:hypothetical protein
MKSVRPRHGRQGITKSIAEPAFWAHAMLWVEKEKGVITAKAKHELYAALQLPWVMHLLCCFYGSSYDSIISYL